jgi:ferrous iron transport protein A
MTLTQLNKGDHATIVKINADKALKERLASFGIVRGEEISLKGCSIGKQTIEIDVDGTFIALRAEEAEKIEVEKIEKD